MTPVKLHGFAQSTYVRTAAMACIELGVPYELVALDFRSPDHRTLHPFLKMPILSDGDATICETIAILAHLDEKAGRSKLFPKSGSSRISVLSIMSAAGDNLYQPVVHGEDESAIVQADAGFDWMQSLLKDGDFLAGQDLSGADLFLAPMLSYHLKRREPADVFVERKALSNWYDRMKDRASFAQTDVA